MKVLVPSEDLFTWIINPKPNYPFEDTIALLTVNLFLLKGKLRLADSWDQICKPFWVQPILQPSLFEFIWADPPPPPYIVSDWTRRVKHSLFVTVLRVFQQSQTETAGTQLYKIHCPHLSHYHLEKPITTWTVPSLLITLDHSNSSLPERNNTVNDGGRYNKPFTKHLIVTHSILIFH